MSNSNANTNNENSNSKGNLTNNTTFTLLPTTASMIHKRHSPGTPGNGDRLQTLRKEKSSSSSSMDGTMHVLNSISRKRKLSASEDNGVAGVTRGVKKLKVEENPWAAFDEMAWQVKSGKLYGKWNFEEQQ